jgi:hypothetical protein
MDATLPKRGKRGPYAKRQRTVLAAIVFFCFLAGPTQAQLVSGNKLFEYCQDHTSIERLSVCDGYILGAADASSLAASKRVCIPSGASAIQIRDAVIKWLADHPGQRHGSAALLILLSLIEVFPCKKNSN